MDITESVNRILQSDDLVGGEFYKRFFLDCPHLKSHFEGVDMSRQASLLTSAIVLVETFHTRYGGGLVPYLRILGKRHQEMSIPKDAYPEWTQSMIRTLAEFHGEDWSATLKSEWETAIRNAISIMIEGYDEPATE